MGGAPADSPTPDCSEKVHVSSLALLKMLKHGRAGVPMEVMGLMEVVHSQVRIHLKWIEALHMLHDI